MPKIFPAVQDAHLRRHIAPIPDGHLMRDLALLLPAAKKSRPLTASTDAQTVATSFHDSRCKGRAVVVHDKLVPLDGHAVTKGSGAHQKPPATT